LCRALDIVASLPFVTAATPSRTIEGFAAVFADLARTTPLAEVATLQGYRPEIICNLIGAMVEWRRCELDNQMAALGAEEVSALAQLAGHFVCDPLLSQPVTDGPATRRLHPCSGAIFVPPNLGAIDRHLLCLLCAQGHRHASRGRGGSAANNVRTIHRIQITSS
jgi:hypothetical protein